ncbi:hypothetical protein [Catellatospora methionotrophica]|uniref:hypothetical protein n=1 Tax=Catellatospora methionotrophica TaxID=121620 RepID=UPI0033C171CE
MTVRRRTPQEKKQLSYAKDRRNNYGENDKSSRTSIRSRKRTPNRANRLHAQQALHHAAGPVDEQRADDAEQRLHRKRPRRWRKWPDLPLGAHVEGSLRLRARLDQAAAPRTDVALDRLSRRRKPPPQGKNAIRA